MMRWWWCIRRTRKGISTASTWRARALSKIPKAKDEKRLYFAYGSNLSLAQIKLRCPDHKPKGTAVLSNHRVVCNKKGDNGVDFYAGIVCSPGDEVLGALYQLTEADINRLDASEGCIEGGRHYIRNEKDFFVRNRETGEVINAFTYFVVKPLVPKKPTTVYAEKIFQGCRDHGFPDEYMRNLRKWFLMEPETP